MSIASHVTVFRAGHVAGEREISETSIEDMATLMVGRKVKLTADVPPPPELKEPVLELNAVSLQSHHSLKDLNFQVRAGEVVGISGVEGNGQAELLQVLLHPKEYGHSLKGEIKILGQDTRHLTTEQIK